MKSLCRFMVLSFLLLSYNCCLLLAYVAYSVCRSLFAVTLWSLVNSFSLMLYLRKTLDFLLVVCGIPKNFLALTSHCLLVEVPSRRLDKSIHGDLKN